MPVKFKKILPKCKSAEKHYTEILYDCKFFLYDDNKEMRLENRL